MVANVAADLPQHWRLFVTRIWLDIRLMMRSTGEASRPDIFDFDLPLIGYSPSLCFAASQRAFAPGFPGDAPRRVDSVTGS
jgi:hypothetical protein